MKNASLNKAAEWQGLSDSELIRAMSGMILQQNEKIERLENVIENLCKTVSSRDFDKEKFPKNSPLAEFVPPFDLAAFERELFDKPLEPQADEITPSGQPTHRWQERISAIDAELSNRKKRILSAISLYDDERHELLTQIERREEELYGAANLTDKGVKLRAQRAHGALRMFIRALLRDNPRISLAYVKAELAKIEGTGDHPIIDVISISHINSTKTRLTYASNQNPQSDTAKVGHSAISKALDKERKFMKASKPPTCSVDDFIIG